MISYKEFVEEAISNYKSLPTETNDLYKKYFIEVPLDLAQADVDIAKHEATVEAMSKDIGDKTRIRFDAVISDHSVRSFNQNIRILRPEELDREILSDKLFKSTDDKLAAYSNANAKRFILIDTKDGKTEKFNLLFINEGNLPVQVIAKAGKRSKIELVEIYVSSSDRKSTIVALNEILAGEEAEVELNVLHNEGKNTNVVSLCKGATSNGSKVRANFVFNGGLLTKSKNIIDSSGEGCEVDIKEIAFGNNEQRFDLSTSMANTTPRSTARLESGTVLDGRSQCMLKGYAKVVNGAKGCFSKITERGILLSMDAHVDALPDMSIDYSNEVKAAHSAATAPLDKEAMFYLMSRGLEEERARKVFITAFIAKYLSNMRSGIASEVAMSLMLEKLERGTFGEMPDVTSRGIWIAR